MDAYKIHNLTCNTSSHFVRYYKLNPVFAYELSHKSSNSFFVSYKTVDSYVNLKGVSTSNFLYPRQVYRLFGQSIKRYIKKIFII